MLPCILWFIIIVGALISLCSSVFFMIEDVRVHGFQVVLLAASIGMVIVMIFAMDRSFRGDLAISSGPYQLVYDQLMKP